MSAATITRAATFPLFLCTVACTAATPADIGMRAKGEACKQVSDCKAGLDCVSSVCTELPPLTTGPQRGDPCGSDADCAPDLFCGRQDVCTTSPLLAAGDSCALTLQCAEPLVCNGQTGVCSAAGGPGTLDLGAACETILDCQRPYVCGFDNTCQRLPFITGANCSRSNSEAGAFRVYWELPPAGTPPADYEFYRLPFPSDLRVKDGHVTLAGHSSPGQVLGIDVTATYFGAVETDAPGFALNQPIFFTFADVVDEKSLCVDAGGVLPTATDPAAPVYCADGGSATVYLVNVDAASADYGKHVPVQLTSGRDGGMYICQNWLGLAPKDGEPLTPATTYAAIVTTGVKDLRGGAPIRDLDFEAIMSGTKTEAAMQPLFAWVSAKGIDASTIAAATVFTTATPTTVAAKLRQAVAALTPAPTFDNDVVLCDTGVVSACEDGLSGAEDKRGCTAADAGFRHFQGTYQGPVFQAGTRPYVRPSAGGAFSYDGQGLPQKQRNESMCFALATPTAAPQSGGYPVIIYAHGTGGSYRSAIDEGLAAELVAKGFAVIGIDNVMHGIRAWPTFPTATELQAMAAASATTPLVFDADPGHLFFNLLNPKASRDNILQGSADLFFLTRLLAATGDGTHLVPGSANVYFNPNKIYFLGHSQGTVIAPAYLTAETALKAAVLSGAGADLALSILNKKNPADISLAASAVFADQTLGRIHPMMGIIAMLFSPADAISYAPLLIHTHAERGPLPYLHISGIDDSLTPNVTHEAMMRAAGTPIVAINSQPEVAVADVRVVASPLNAGNAQGGVVAGVTQFTPSGADDGHYVMFDVPAAKATRTHFFETANNGSPEISR
ncbi:MAG: hypothetical protein HY903_03245 [Deltaproteobacteria bacterium]|nr:hypothetical protein [Deltaproteobacteria bacterium]